MSNNTKINYDQLRSEHLRIIYDLAQQMARVGDEEKILAIVLDQLMKETGAEVGAFITYDPERDRFEPRTIKTDGQLSKEKVHFSQTVFRQVKESKEAILSFDTRADQQYSKTQSVIINQIHAILAFPLIIKDEVYGILYFDSRRNRQSFNEASRPFLSFFSVVASLALEQVLRKKQIESENVLLQSQLDQQLPIPTLVGKSEPMQQLFRLIRKVARSDASVIITGENGTGKDLVARAIHDLSPRRDKPYIAQYIGNIPPTILESELFGYKKGAFTGAHRDKIGLFEAVNGGSLFLDEIGDLPLDLQTKLLRVLQNKEIKRLGENTVRPVDVRIIAATNRDLKKLVRDGKFREDFYYRLNVINIHVPPLRERRDDIPLLAEHFLKKSHADQELKISKEALKKLMSYHYPGNVRQLENIINRAVILSENNVIDEDAIQFDDVAPTIDSQLLMGTMEELKNQIIRQRIEHFNGNKSQAARSLNISLRSLQQKAKELGL